MGVTNILGVGSRVHHPAYGDGVIIRLHQAAYDVCFMTYGIKPVGKDYTAWDVLEEIPAEEPITYTDAEKSLMRILRQWSDISEVVPIGDRWAGGTIILRPKDPGLKEKEIPIEIFFHKIVMMRDRLRVMEQRINSSHLSTEDKINLQQYITRIYGSLTTFNILFKNKDHLFKGESTKED
ncbi:MAG TPA: hypothetical protein VI603_12115 [Saprospiraceae bacterium]|nr:hypothetical protein [Saprospiraceae bacterium]